MEKTSTKVIFFLLVAFAIYYLCVHKYCIDQSRNIALYVLNIDAGSRDMSDDDLQTVLGLEDACMQRFFY